MSLAADELDMLVTSKNHDLKAGRMRTCQPEDWLYALVSVQTQEGFLGAGNYGISRMNGGFASRPGISVASTSLWGGRWRGDVCVLLQSREQIAQSRGLDADNGIALVWTIPWDGATSLAFSRLDPAYIEICRRIRLQFQNGRLFAMGTGTQAARIAAKGLDGVTGDPWTPVNVVEGKALTIGAEGFHYKLMAELLFGSTYQPGAAADLGRRSPEPGASCVLLAQGLTRGQGKTEGYHERRVPVSPRLRSLLAGSDRNLIAKISEQRIHAISEVRKLLWLSLTVLFNNGASGRDSSDSVKTKAREYSRPFEQLEDLRFFEDLNLELEADDPAAQRLQWLQEMVDRALSVLRNAFDAGPRNAVQRYRAQAAALSCFHGSLRGPRSPLPDLAQHYRQAVQHRRQEEDIERPGE